MTVQKPQSHVAKAVADEAAISPSKTMRYTPIKPFHKA
jgi:hypothetical protein